MPQFSGASCTAAGGGGACTWRVLVSCTVTECSSQILNFQTCTKHFGFKCSQTIQHMATFNAKVRV
ncbi:hypothetical protein AAFF_G00004630 [Aldrovandia affinis]|uniref:Uncharacterized protein n=1 Tax=Aldrovandia affinis TaxID=143900 RepID=A0AAD7X537_9TELE|nr:hypothetical protein AAFF_G00004630 [Aldrovandia affinis]